MHEPATTHRTEPAPPAPDSGVATTEILMWTALIVVVLAGFAGLLELLGADIVDYVRGQIGV